MLTDRLYEFAARTPDAPFVFWRDREIGFGEMASLVSSYAARLHDNGIREGDHVALLAGNSPGFLVVWFALTELGAVTVPLNTALVGDGLRYSLVQSEAVALIIEPSILAQKRSDLDQLDTPVPIVLLDDAAADPPTSAPPRARRGSGRPDALNMILYTSGTTGLPKGAMISNGCFLQAGDDMSASLQLTAADRTMVFLPLFHANPQMYAVSSALAVGSAMILIEKFSATEFFPVARRFGATGFTYVGTVLSILDKRNPGEDRNHSIRFGVGGGAPTPVWRSIEQRFGLTIHELYGMTETGGWVTMNTPENHKFGSVGAPRAGLTIRLVDEKGRDLPIGAKGEIVARSDRQNLFFAGYWKKPDITAAMMVDGWLHTGDRGWLDQDGFLYFDGRMKELIRRAGEMISPVEIELQLLKHPAVRDCAVVGVEDEILGEEIKAVVVTATPVKPEALREFLAGRIAPHMLPRYFGFADSIPKTETQKIKRHELVENRGDVFDLNPPPHRS